MLWAKKPGFLEEPGSQRGTYIGPAQNEVTLSLVPEGLIVGRVQFPSSKTADRVQLQLYTRQVRDGFAQWVQLKQVTTRSDGEFRFADLPVGSYKLFSLESLERDPLIAIPNGPLYAFPPMYFPEARDFATGDTIQLSAGQEVVANLALVRQRYYEVKIPVVNAQPGPVPGLMVAVHAQGHRGPGFQLGFDPSNQAITGSLPNGNYIIEGSVDVPGPEPGYSTGIANVTVSNRPVNGSPMTLTPNPSIEINIRQDLTSGDKTPPRPGRDGTRQPVAYVTLQSAAEISDDRGSAMTYQSQGDPPTLVGVKPARYWVQVRYFGGYAASLTSGSTNLLREPLVVPFGASLPAIEITLRDDGAEIEATVAATPNEDAAPATQTNSANYIGAAVGSFPLRQAYVVCVPVANEGGEMKQLSMRPDGTYVLQQVPPGDYRILAFEHTQQLEYRNPEAMRAYDSKGQVIHVAPGEKAHIKLQLSESE